MLCEECSRPLEEDGTCWKCHYESLQRAYSLRAQGYESTITRLEAKVEELSDKIRQLEDAEHNIEEGYG